jgi:chromosome partitioning protein
MKVISFVSQKGGSGKSTLAISCAVVAGEQNKKVLILDMDPQKTSENWYQARQGDTPQLAVVNHLNLESAVEGATSKGYDFLFIDTPGRDEPCIASVIKQSDFCLIPCRPTPNDMKATPPTVSTIKRLEKPFCFVLTQTPFRGLRIKEAETALSIFGLVCPVKIVMRTSYQDAQGCGLGVTEYEPSGKASEEIRLLWQWLETKMEKMCDES